MPSPFPGMDPWLEDPDVFPDIHDALITLLREAVNAALPRGYVARGRNRVWVDDQSRSEPDVSLIGRKRRPPAGAARLVPSGMLALGVERSDPTEEPYLEILATTGKRPVTAVEVLSPSNKRAGGAGRKDYLKKQKEFRLAGVNAVEIDLLRRGRHTTAAPLATLKRKAGAFDYHVSVRVAGDPTELFAAPVCLTDRLPAVGLPLDPGMEFVTVDLQPLLDRAYDGGKYTEDTGYGRPPDPPLTAEQQAWADGVLREKGLLR